MSTLPFGSSILISEAKSISKGYGQTNLFLKGEPVKMLEGFALLNGHWVTLLNGPVESLKKISSKYKKQKDILNLTLVENCPDELIKGFYNLLKTEARDALLVFEFKFLGQLFEVANLGLSNKISIVEIRSGRSLLNKNLMIMTAPTQDLKNFQALVKKHKLKSLNSQLIDSMAPSLRDSFGYF